jgi:hypothetical protein
MSGNVAPAGKWTFEPAKFDYGATGFSADSKIPLLVNADWDAATQTIGSFSKGRGLGDCGSSESWVWDGTMFRLTDATVMGECRGFGGLDPGVAGRGKTAYRANRWPPLFYARFPTARHTCRQLGLVISVRNA